MKAYKALYRTFVARLLNRRLSSLRRKAYCTPDELPIYNWWQIQATQDVSFLLRTRHQVNTLDKQALNVIFGELFDKYIERFGFNDTTILVYRKKAELIRLKSQRIMYEDNSLCTFIDILEYEIAEIEGKEKADGAAFDFFKIKGYVDKFMGYAINPHEVSVTEFYNYIKMMQDGRE